MIPGSGPSPGEGNDNPPHCSYVENHIERTLVNYSPWGHKELDATEHVHTLTVQTQCSHIILWFICRNTSGLFYTQHFFAMNNDGDLHEQQFNTDRSKKSLSGLNSLIFVSKELSWSACFYLFCPFSWQILDIRYFQSR